MAEEFEEENEKEDEDEDEDEEEAEDAKGPVVITNVREYKASLAVSPGPQPVKDLSEFEEGGAKL
jgi:hypothetical protein